MTGVLKDLNPGANCHREKTTAWAVNGLRIARKTAGNLAGRW